MYDGTQEDVLAVDVYNLAVLTMYVDTIARRNRGVLIIPTVVLENVAIQMENVKKEIVKL